MRLLQRDEAGEVSFTEDLPETDLPSYPYAIPSHRWGPPRDEVSYEDILKDPEKGKSKPGYRKIHFCVEQSRRDGLEYFWLDTCCINKQDSAELSKSLISMFRWYQKAQKCYVHLSDVYKAEDERETDWGHALRGSVWFRRGWTLQELIAPACVGFFAECGTFIGSKKSLEKEINDITRIPIEALRGKPLPEFTVQERRLWQEGRETREPEDLVYSLLGMLGVSMPVLYGEGRAKAWERLESAITAASQGRQHNDFFLTFSLAEASVETENFVARTRELAEMRQHLSGDGSRQVVVVHGLGGMGKTQLAMAYAKRYKDDYSGMLWLNAKDEAAIKSSFAKAAKQVLRNHPGATGLATLDVERDVDAVVPAVKAWLSIPLNSRWLLICDNYDNPKVPENKNSAALDLRQYLPEAHQGCVIVTTRSSEVRLGHCFRLDKLDPLKDGLQVLENSSGRVDLAGDEDARKLAAKLDGLPLALATAGAFLRQSTMTFAEYLDHFEKLWLELQERSPALMTYENGRLYSTWQISYEQIKQRSPMSAELLRLWAYFDNQDLWFELLQRLNEQDEQWMQELGEDRLVFEDCMRVICDHGLATANVENVFGIESTGYSVHPCVHAWTAAVLTNEGDLHLARAALECVASRGEARDTPHGPAIQRRLLSHANRCIRFGLADLTDDSKLAWAFNNLGNLFSDQGDLSEAEELYMYSLGLKEEELGAAHPSTLQTVNNLGNLYYKQGKLEEAKEMYLRALRGKEKALGADHLSTLNTVNNLGNLYDKQGKVEEAEGMYLRALRGTEKALGADHPSTLDTVNNLGVLYYDQGKVEEAEEMYLRALRGKEKALGADHPSTLYTVNNLGNLYDKQGKLEEVEGLYLRALRGKEKALGADHLSTLNTVNNLGNLYDKQEKVEEAEEMYLRALRGTEKALGADHPSTLYTVNNLGNLYDKQGKVEEAEGMYLRALRGTEKALEAEHPRTLEIVHNLGALYRDHQRFEEGEEMLVRALDGKERVSGANHPSTLLTVAALSHLRTLQQRIEEAERLYRRAREGYERMPREHRRYLDWLAEKFFEKRTEAVTGLEQSSQVNPAPVDPDIKPPSESQEAPVSKPAAISPMQVEEQCAVEVHSSPAKRTWRTRIAERLRSKRS